MRKLYELAAEFLGKEMEYACLEVSFFHGNQTAWGRGRGAETRKGGKPPDLCLSHLTQSFL